MTIGSQIKAARKRKGMTQIQLADAANISRSYLGDLEGDRYNPSVDTLQKIASALGTTSGILLGEAGLVELIAADNNMEKAVQLFDELRKNPAVEYLRVKNIVPLPRFIKRPRLGTIACGKPILAVDEAEDFDDVPESINCDFTLKCQGDSMINARIFDGDVVYIRIQPEVENGEIAAVRIGNEATLKKVYYTPGSDRITLRACNPMYPDLEYEGDALDEIEVLGKAMAFTSTIR